MSSPQIRRADKVMSGDQTLAGGSSGRLATVSEDGFPCCIPLLHLWLSGEVHVGFLPRLDIITVYAIAVERITGKQKVTDWQSGRARQIPDHHSRLKR